MGVLGSHGEGSSGFGHKTASSLNKFFLFFLKVYLNLFKSINLGIGVLLVCMSV